MGSTWLMVISSILLAVTTLPCFTVRFPVRPLMGDLMVVKPSCTRALSTVALLAPMAAWALSMAASSAFTAWATASALARNLFRLVLRDDPALGELRIACRLRLG